MPPDRCVLATWRRLLREVRFARAVRRPSERVAQVLRLLAAAAFAVFSVAGHFFHRSSDRLPRRFSQLSAAGYPGAAAGLELAARLSVLEEKGWASRAADQLAKLAVALARRSRGVGPRAPRRSGRNLGSHGARLASHVIRRSPSAQTARVSERGLPAGALEELLGHAVAARFSWRGVGRLWRGGRRRRCALGPALQCRR